MGFSWNTNEFQIREAIVKTIAFFDLFDYPLTEFELWQLINIRCEFSEWQKFLHSDNALDSIEQKNGFYFLFGRSETIKIRMKRYCYTDRKFKRAMKIARIFKIVPWIKMIAVGNIIGTHNLKQESDIDLFIITEDKRIWLTRFFCAGLMKLLGLRPKEGKEQDKICLNFYVSTKAMDLKELMLQTDKGNDVYFIYWLVGLAPVYDIGSVYKRFINANNWVKEYLPNWSCLGRIKTEKQGDTDKGFFLFYHDIVDLLLGGLEQNVGKFQLKKMPSDLKEMMNKDTRVVVNDQILKLHVKDRREEYRHEWRKRIVDVELLKWTLR